MADISERGRRGDASPYAAYEGFNRARRRREGDTEVLGLKLPIPDWVRDKYPPQLFEYYWATGTPARLHQLHKNDWEKADGGEGAELPGAADKEGHPVNHVLMVKPKEWFEADRAPRETARKELEDQMRRGPVDGRGDDAGGEVLSSDISYASASNRVA